MRDPLLTIYRLLEERYGYQGWWPLGGRAGDRGYDADGYRLSRRPKPRLSPAERFEIAVGAILTQNTSWENARRALSSMRERGLIDAKVISRTEPAVLSETIRASGYFNQKARKLRLLGEFFSTIASGGGGSTATPGREGLLAIWGVGPETADSILLYAYSRPQFVVDAYARRIFTRVGLVDAQAGYDEIQRLCHGVVPRDAELYGEYHALLVRHARSHCRKSAICAGCPLRACCAVAMEEAGARPY